MLLVAVAWIYVVLMMAVVEALSSQGTVLGGIVTFLLYGLLPLSVVLYVMNTPFRKQAAKDREAHAARTEDGNAGNDGGQGVGPVDAAHGGSPPRLKTAARARVRARRTIQVQGPDRPRGPSADMQ